MRMTDAETELLHGAGLRVHRSHWVSRSAVTGRRRDGDRLFLSVSDGAEIPVSRSARARVREAGLDRG